MAGHRTQPAQLRSRGRRSATLAGPAAAPGALILPPLAVNSMRYVRVSMLRYWLPSVTFSRFTITSFPAYRTGC